MNAPAMIGRLLRCAFDADARVLDWLEARRIDDPSLLGWQSHILLAQRRWGSRIAGVPDDGDVLAVLDLPSQREIHRAAPRRLLEAAEGDLSRTFAFVRAEARLEMSVGDALLQVATHGHHHHGQMATQARRLDLPAFPDTSFLGFTRSGG